MHSVSNFFCVSRESASSVFERGGDCLLAPARVLFCGKKVAVLGENVIEMQQKSSKSSDQCPRVAVKVAAFVALPFAALGALVKAVALKDRNYREFCARKIEAPHPKFIEIFQHVHETARFVEDIGYVLVFKPLGLSECACATGAFHRLYSPRRNALENAIIQQLVKNYPDKTQPIHLLSMGSAGLMCDFFILEKLVLEGFKRMTLDCVEPAGINPIQLESVRQFFVEYPAATIDIEAYRNVDEVPGEKIGYAAVLAIDYDALAHRGLHEEFYAASDLMKAYRRLDTKGVLGLGFSSDDTLSGPSMDPVILSSRSPVIYSLSEDIILQLPSKEELVIAIPSICFAYSVQIFLLSIGMAVEKSRHFYRRVSLACTAEIANRRGVEEVYTAMQVFFRGAEIDVSIQGLKDRKCDFLFTGSLETEFKSQTHLSPLSPEGAAYILYSKGSIVRQRHDQEGLEVIVRE